MRGLHYVSSCVCMWMAVQLSALICSTAAVPTYEELFDAVGSQKQLMEDTFKVLHQHPELMYQEYYTSEIIQKVLQEFGVTYTTGWSIPSHNKSIGGTGVVAEIGTGKPPCIALRADIDALPITEKVDVPYKSLNSNRMHACGHDGHITMLLGAAWLLKRHEKELKGTIRLIFQPAEELGGGAKYMDDEGVLTKYPAVERIFAFHVNPAMPTGAIAISDTISMAALDSFTIVVTGVGGHGAMHHLTVDPIVASAAIIRGLYDVYARELYFQLDTAGLISVTKIQGGTTGNVIPASVEMMGTIRAFSMERIDYIRSRVKAVAMSIANAYRCEVSIKFGSVVFPPVVNNMELSQFFKEIAKDGALGNVVDTVEPTMTGDDFAYFSQKVPGSYAWIGIGSGGSTPNHPPTTYPLHSDYFALDTKVLPIGSAMHAHFAFQSIEDLLGNNKRMSSDAIQPNTEL